MDAQARVAHASHERLGLVVADGDLGADRAFEVGHGDVDDLVQLALLGRERRDLLIDARDEDLALRRDELAEEGEEVRHRLVHDGAEHAAVQIGARTRYRARKVAQTAQAIRQARGGGPQPVVVCARGTKKKASALVPRALDTAGSTKARRRGRVRTRDAHGVDVGKLALGLLDDELLEPLRARLLHALEAELEVDRELGAGLLVRLDDVQPTQNLAEEEEGEGRRKRRKEEERESATRMRERRKTRGTESVPDLCRPTSRGRTGGRSPCRA